MSSLRHIAAFPFLALAFGLWAAGIGLARLSDAAAAGAGKIMGPRQA
jgi:hypothetical protein